jgi:predicted Zn-dependent peptidase
MVAFREWIQLHCEFKKVITLQDIQTYYNNYMASKDARVVVVGITQQKNI